MKRLVLVLAMALIAPSLFAQPWRDRPYQRYTDGTFDLTPFVGYRWGGTIRADQTNLYGQDVDLQSSANYGVNFDIPINREGLKLELMVNRQDTTVGTGGGLFAPPPLGALGDFHVTYYHAGVLIPFNESRTATPYAVVSAGITNLDPATPGVSSANKFSASAGVGVKVPFTPNLSLRVEGRGFFTSMTNNDNGCSSCRYSYGNGYNRDLYQGEASVGLAVRF